MMQVVQQSKLMMILLCVLWLPAQATTSAIDAHLDNAQLVGKARLKVLLWKVFDASLYADSGQYSANAPFALSLRYLRALDGEKIVSKSMEEIRRQGPDTNKTQLARWEAELYKIIPDVTHGTTITGVRTNDGYTVFYLGEEKIGGVNDPAFTQAFFNIWLGEQTSVPKTRSKLLGSNIDA